MKYIAFTLCLAVGIFISYLAPYPVSLDASAVTYEETLPAHCRQGDTAIILSDKLREDFLCVQTNEWVRTLSYSIVD